MLNRPPNIKLPALKWYQQQTEMRLAVDHETMSINKITDMAKREQTIYSHYEAIIEGELEAGSTWLITKVLFPILAIITALTAISSFYFVHISL